MNPFTVCNAQSRVCFFMQARLLIMKSVLHPNSLSRQPLGNNHARGDIPLLDAEFGVQNLPILGEGLH